MKKQVLVVANHLTIGGAQKSLLSALGAIDYTQNDVTLYIRKKRLDLVEYVDSHVNVIVNDDCHKYYRKPRAVYLQLQCSLSQASKNADRLTKYKRRLSDCIKGYVCGYESKRFFQNKHYDIAVAYWEGLNAEFVAKYVSADKKIMFYQVSIDEEHEIHESIFPVYDKIVCEHEDIKHSLVSWYGNIGDKIYIINNYTNYRLLERLSQEERVTWPADKLMICTCSRFSPEKGIDLAVEAANVLKQRRLPFLWYLAGDGPEREKIERLIKEYRLEDCVVLPGMLKNPYPYMAACDIFVQPSREEALSISMLESQLLCAPMVSTKTAGGLAMVQDGVNGLLADIDPVSLADAIERLLVNDDLRRKIKGFLSSVDYAKEEARYRGDWKRLLEDF